MKTFRLRPSAAPIWGYCSGSVVASEAFPNFETPEAAEGTAAHGVASEEFINQTFDAGRHLGETFENGVVIDDDIVEGAQVFIDDVLSVADQHGARRHIISEVLVEMPSIHPENGGTPDAVLVLLDANKIYIWDYKHGHARVGPRSFQLIDYAKGVCERLRIDGHQEQTIDVHLRIVQPFAYKPCGAVEEFVCKLSDLRPDWNTLNAQAYEALGTSPTLTPGRHCRYCPAAFNCSANREAAFALADFVKMPYRMDETTPDQNATEYTILRDAFVMLSARLEATEEAVKENLKQGAVNTGYVLEGGKGRLAWTKPSAVVRAFCEQFGAKADADKVKTPTQILNALPKEKRPVFEKAIKSITEKPDRGLKLTRDDNSKVRRAFQRK